MIRQAISCDICGTEMLNANHWFIAQDRGAELRISVWNARNRVKASTRHLCGHKCLHKLVDDFMAKTVSAPASLSAGVGTKPAIGPPHRMQTLPVISSNVEEFESSAQLIRPPELVSARATSASASIHLEAWKRERQRQAEQSATHRSIA